MGRLNTNPNDPQNVFATVFGLVSDGTSWLFDVLVTIVLVAVLLGVIDWFIPDAAQTAMPVITNTLIIVPGCIFGVYVWRRAQADNVRRAEAKRAGQ